jgi:hypothetical protein
MQQIETKKRGFGWRLFAAALAPFVVASVYLIFSRWPSYRFTTFSDFTCLGVSVFVGALFVATLPIRLQHRVFWLLIYIPVVVAMLALFALVFIAVVFHDGL